MFGKISAISAIRHSLAVFAAAGLLALTPLLSPAIADPLASWNDGPTKQAVVSFVERVSDSTSVDFVPPQARIAVFDNDGTLWVEQPMYSQLAFALDRIKSLAAAHPEWQKSPVLNAAIKGDMKALIASGNNGLFEVLAVTHAGTTPEAFEAIVTDWLARAEHPRFQRKYTDLAYLPMLELLDYLRASGFSTYIVSGGGIEFMRPWTREVYGIPPENVVGSNIKTRLERIDGKPTLMRLPELGFVNDGPGKPVGINVHIGQRPIAAFGNSDGDMEMLEWTTAGEGPRLAAILHHTDAEREYAYDRNSPFGRLDKALDSAAANGWVIIDMKKDWKTVFAPAK